LPAGRAPAYLAVRQDDETVPNSDRFLEAFAGIERWLRRAASAERGATFYQVVDRAAERNAAVRRHRHDLKEFADLRNAIVHERTDEHVIAEPNARAVTGIQRLETLLTSPPRVLPHFQRKVATTESEWPLGRAAALMSTRAFSQLPVLRSGRVVALLTANTIARWLGDRAGDGIVDLSGTTVTEVLRFAEDLENHVFFGRAAALAEVLERFDEFESRGKVLDAALLTHGGRSSESLLGIITPHDIPRILAILGGKG
jgi:CBS domain-containing protein